MDSRMFDGAVAAIASVFIAIGMAIMGLVWLVVAVVIPFIMRHVFVR